MFYECYDKNGNYIGYTRSQIEASRLTERANLRLMEQEGVPMIHRVMYMQKMEEERKKMKKKQAIGAKIYIVFLIIGLLCILLTSLG